MGKLFATKMRMSKALAPSVHSQSSMLPSVIVPKGQLTRSRTRSGLSQPALAKTWTSSRLVTVQATNGGQGSEEEEMRRLIEENNRLRKVMASTASKLEPEKKKKFAQRYQKIAEAEIKLGFEVDTQLLQAVDMMPVVAQASATFGSQFSGNAMARASRGGSAGASTAVLDPPVEPGYVAREHLSQSPMADEIDSVAYLQDIVNLSVDLDPDDDSDTENAPADAAVRLPTMPVMEPAVFMEAAAAVMETHRAEDGPQLRPERRTARSLVQRHTPEGAVANKHHWMVVTVPEQPVAGEEFVVYFNRKASDALRERPRIQLQYGFNNWELKSRDDIDKVELMPTSVTRDHGADFWSCRIQVPQEAYELQFVLNDGEGRFENNGDKNFYYPVVAGITREQWLDTAAERAAEAALAKAAADAAAAAEMEKQRKAALLQQDKDNSQKKANDMKNNYDSVRANGATSKNAGGDPARPLWKASANPRAGSKVQLMYNKAVSPLANIHIPEDKGLTLRYGFNGWQTPASVTMTRDTKKAVQGQDWWVAEVEVPVEAAAVNFVLNYEGHYDNNDRQDYKLNVDLPAGETLDSWTAGLAETFFKQMYQARIAAEEAERVREEARVAKRRQAQALVQAVERRKVRHVLYTEPEVLQAGKHLKVFYNPQNTVLNGRGRIFLRGGWNRWNHARPFGPIEMIPPGPGGMHFEATVKIPPDAFKMDFVFSDVESGDGTYDTRGGFDYHLPVEGSAVREPSLYVAHVAVEMAPIAKVGGLGDVVTALGRAVKDLGHQVEVILPKYQFFNSSPVLQGKMKYETEFDWGGTRVFVTTAEVEGLRCFFIEPRNGFFDTQSVYGRYDDEVRFDFFCKAALEFLLRTNRQPDILHCHDWSTAYMAKTYWDDYHPFGLWKPKVVFTIHNLNYGKAKLSQAAYYCQRFTTVSPTYAFEVGGNPIISSQTHKFLGVRNGIDMDLWDPENNEWLPMPFSSSNVVEGKKAARKALRERVGLGNWGEDKFIVGVVSRLTGQKGVPLIKHAAHRAVERGGQFVLLGSAPDPKVQADFNNLANSYNGDVARFCFKYDEPLSHLIYAACDMIVVPSMFEPCGLTQMIAMRYGAVPIVRHTGGLKDTVFDVDFDKARAAWEVYGSSDWQRDGLDATNGFAFEGTDTGALDYAMNRAIDAWYNDKAWFHSLQKRVMEQDWSWNRPALDYIELYHGAKKA